MNCEEASIVCNKLQYQEAGIWEKIQLRFHLLICKACASFSKKNKELTVLIKKAPLHCLSEEEKQGLEKKLKTEL
ncbi:hypothetical protein [Eudoraea sp.]|uniref:hypothetical protein n=1 Tax=Eudoraea sp. TaxID=1979955 RepID=UPI003C76D3A4